MLNEFHRLHITYTGASNLASAWVPFAKSKLRDLLKQQVAFPGTRNQVARYTPADGVRVAVRVTGEDKFIHIDATSGCDDRLGFLMSRLGANYTALYNDGTHEDIIPTNGSPRPVPDSAVRTKGYGVPTQLQREQPARVTASKFSGLMRLAVGCYHAAGKDAPFSPTFATTHGIVRKTVLIANVPTVKHWVVEISALGVYAAPIVGGDLCCESWDVSAYKLTSTETLSLLSAYTRRVARVTNLIPQGDMATIYADGDAWFADCGWAFSASGAEAQAVLQDFYTSPAEHYKCARWKIAFDVNGAGELSAIATAVERLKIAVFVKGNPVWSPTFAGEWTANVGATSLTSPSPFTAFPSSEAPVHVFYVGETEIVSRWVHTRSSEAEVDTASTTAYVTDPVPHVAASCASPGTHTTTGYLTGTPGHRIDAHTLVTLGFSNPSFSHIGQAFSRGERTETFAYGAPSENISTFGNFYTLDPSCYYIDSGSLITACSSTFEYTRTEVETSKTTTTFTNASGHNSALVLFAEEREAVMGVYITTASETGTATFQQGATTYYIHEVTAKIDSGPCPWVAWDNDMFGGAATAGVLPYSTTHTAHTEVGAATLVVGGNAFSTAIAFGGAPNYEPVETDLSAFVEGVPPSPAESSVQAMHGNLYYPDALLSPMLQRDNYLYSIGSGLVVSGGFEQPNDPIAFVGKA